MSSEESGEDGYSILTHFVLYLVASIAIVGGFVVVFPDVVVRDPVIASLGVVGLAIVMTGYSYFEED